MDGKEDAGGRAARRQERELAELEDPSTLLNQPIKHQSFVPKTIFERNVSPGLVQQKTS